MCLGGTTTESGNNIRRHMTHTVRSFFEHYPEVIANILLSRAKRWRSIDEAFLQRSGSFIIDCGIALHIREN